jgi:hypothetical protein
MSVFTNQDAANILLSTQPKLYLTLVEALGKGVAPESVLYMVRLTVDGEKTPDDPQAGELIYNLSALTVDYLCGIARQVSHTECGQGEGIGGA